jgi:preprotein translocase subunit SecG
MTLLTPILYILFVLSAIILVVVILLQEGKGGGFSDALGAGGQQTFGVKAAGIHKFTMAMAVLFFGCALGIHILNRGASEGGGMTSINSPVDSE